MKVLYSSNKVEKLCSSPKEAKKLFGGDTSLAYSLLSRINALENAETLLDIARNPTFHFHKLKNKNGKNFEGNFAIDVKSRKQAWRIIFRSLDDDGKEYNFSDAEFALKNIKIVEVKEISEHYA